MRECHYHKEEEEHRRNKGTHSNTKHKTTQDNQGSPQNTQSLAKDTTNSVKDILSQSRSVFYGQEGSNLQQIGQIGQEEFVNMSLNGHSNVYQCIPPPNSTQMNTGQINTMQGQTAGLQYSQGQAQMNTNMSNGPNTNANKGPNSATTSSMPQTAAAMCQQCKLFRYS